MYLDVQKISIQ